MNIIIFYSQNIKAIIGAKINNDAMKIYYLTNQCAHIESFVRGFYVLRREKKKKNLYAKVVRRSYQNDEKLCELYNFLIHSDVHKI